MSPTTGGGVLEEDRDAYFFDDVIAAHTGPDFVDRQWLEDRIASGLDDHACRYVLLTAEPGAGKTCLLAGLARRRPDWLRYFTQWDSQTSLTGPDARSLLLSIGHQLASSRPELFHVDSLDIEGRHRVKVAMAAGQAVDLRIQDLAGSPFHGTALLRIDQSAQQINGTPTGIEIGHTELEPRLLEPVNLIQLALIAPATVLSMREPQARIVVLIDAVDDHLGGSGLLEWLENGPELPPNVTLVLTSRTHRGWEPFRRRRAGQVIELCIDPDSSQVLADLITYAGRVARTATIANAIEAHGLVPAEFAETIAARAQGNFAYLVTYHRALVDAIERFDDGLRDRLLHVPDLPPGLHSLYGLFMESIRNDIARLGMLEVPEPDSPQLTRCPAWEGVGQPVLGVLAVAREALTLDQLIRLSRVRVWRRDMANVLARLRQFVDTTPAGVRLFHSSLAEFLLSEQARAEYPEWAVEEQEWHERIALSYRDGASNWQDVDWSMMDGYGLRNVAIHLARCRGRLADEIVELVTPQFRQALCAAGGTDRDFLAVIDLAAHRAVHHFAPPRALPAALFLGAVSWQERNIEMPRGITRLSHLRLYLEPAAIARALLPAPSSIDAPYSWERTLRCLAEEVGQHRLDVVENLVGQIADPGERAIGLATLAVQASDTDAVARLLSAAMAALEKGRRYEWSGGDDWRSDLAYLLPDRRARFEVALRRLACTINEAQDVTDINSVDIDGAAADIDAPFLSHVCRVSWSCLLLPRLLEWTTSRALCQSAIDSLYENADRVRAWPDGPLAHLMLARLVAAEQILRGRAGGLSTSPLTVPDPVYSGLADLFALQAGLPVAERLVGMVHDLLSTDRLPEVAHLASLTAATQAATDPAGAYALVEHAAATAQRYDSPLVRGVALAHLATPVELASIVDTAALVTEAAHALEGTVSAAERGALLEVLFPAMVATRSPQVAQRLLTAVRTEWREAMALLEWAATPLVCTHGVGIVQDLVAAVARAQSFYQVHDVSSTARPPARR